MGQREALSFLDIQMANAAYKCSEKCAKKVRCENGGFLNHECKCFCPDGLTGPFCEALLTNVPSKKIEVKHN